MGPAGDLIFHFHEPYPISENPGNLIKPVFEKKIDHGFVLLFMHARNENWVKTV
jgi:hypothetical protein